MESEREARELQLGAMCDEGAFRDAAGHLVRAFGSEIYRFIASITHDETGADDAFSAFSEQVLTGLPRFQRRSSFRTWAYAIARNAALQVRLAGARRRRVETATADDEFLQVAEVVRSETAIHLRTETKSHLARLREELPEDDRALLILRIDRGLDWLDVARVLGPADEAEVDATTLRRKAGALRKRFQTIKERLVERGRAEGLVER